MERLSPHSKAINQHLAREFGLYGANSAEAAQIDIVGETVIDIVAKILPVAYEKDEKKKKELLDDFMDKSSKPFLPYLNNLIETAGGRFFVGNSAIMEMQWRQMQKAAALNSTGGLSLYGANSAEAAQIDIVGETVIDIVAKILPVAYEKDEKKKKELLDDFMDKSSKPFLPYLNNLIETAGGRFFVGNSETLVDIVVYCLLDFIFPMVESAKETYPALAKFYQSLTDNSRLTDYLKNRPPVSK
eukprot:XP_011680300.1 PREDICTED: glutathione S-transferase P 1 [Strongylocentrotus purpuratus]